MRTRPGKNRMKYENRRFSLLRNSSRLILGTFYPRQSFPFGSTCFVERVKSSGGRRRKRGKKKVDSRGWKGKETTPETFWLTISKPNIIFLGALHGDLAGSDSSSHPRTASHHDVLVKYSNGCHVSLIYPALNPAQTTSLISMFRLKAAAE